MTLKERLARRELTIGSWITIGHTIIAEIMARAGYDWLTIDMEHSAITLDAAQELIRVIELCGVTPLVRVGENNAYLIKRVMDAGAHGVIVPMVNSRQDAEAAVRAVRYPPEGQRGVGLARAQQYGSDFEGYRAWNARESIVIVQIEHIRAVDTIAEILSVPGVDGFIIGPYDLSGSLGVPGQFDHPALLAALEKVKMASRQLNALAGFHVIPPESRPLEDKIAEGYKFIAHSLDTLLLAENCRRLLQAARSRPGPS
jgi:2-dehydro-3-deoxyglucarate aldolase